MPLPHDFGLLTPVEERVARHLSAGRSPAAIAQITGIEETTVAVLVDAVTRKLRARDRADAGRRAERLSELDAAAMPASRTLALAS